MEMEFWPFAIQFEAISIEFQQLERLDHLPEKQLVQK
jgi:hypothetical protein